MLTDAQENARRPIQDRTAPPCRYSPIAALPDITGRYVVVWNPCNGPEILRLVLEIDASEFRDSGWTHFLLLPSDP